MTFRLLLSGHDAIECAYYLAPGEGCQLNFERLEVERELLRRSKSRSPTPLKLGSEEFVLAGHGTKSGYPILLENDAFSIQCGEFNKPSFFVSFRSIGLWHASAQGLHERFIAWAQSVGLYAYHPEKLSRVDFAFDYHLPVIDFDEDNFVSQATKDNQYRKHGKVQTFRFGEDQIALRVYNNSDEIAEKSAKTWFYELWGIEKDVWRIEWQVRKMMMRILGIHTFGELQERQGDLVRLLVEQHTTLRLKSPESNRSRWPLHPLWRDVQEQVEKMNGLGVVRELDLPALMEERMMRIAISLYGYMKRIAAIYSLQGNTPAISLKEARAHLAVLMEQIHDPLTWEPEVEHRMRKKLAINEAEAGIVRLAFDLYLNGYEGREYGCKELARYLTDKGLLMRGKPWHLQKIQTLLSDRIYVGEYFTNIRDSKAKTSRPPSEWVRTQVPAIIDAATFERVRVKRQSRAPANTPPRITNSPTLLTGLLKCGCGARMTIATGRSGRYKYYKCSRRHSQGNYACSSGNVPMEKLDSLLLEQLAQKVFAKDRLQVLMAELCQRIRASKDSQQVRINKLNRQLKQVEERQHRLWEVIETGTIELDETTQRRAQQHKAAREALFIELASVRRDSSVPTVEYLKASQVELFGKVLRQKLLAAGSPLAKSYLNILVDEVVVQDKAATIRGSYAALAGTMQKIKVSKLNQVPTFNLDWCARHDSNVRLLPSEGSTLSI